MISHITDGKREVNLKSQDHFPGKLQNLEKKYKIRYFWKKKSVLLLIIMFKYIHLFSDSFLSLLIVTTVAFLSKFDLESLIFSKYSSSTLSAMLVSSESRRDDVRR